MRSLAAVCLAIAALLNGCASEHVATKAGETAAENARTTETLKARISWTGVPFRVKIAGDPIHGEQSLPKFYRHRAYHPVWINDGGILPRANAQLAAVARSSEDGLRPADFHLTALQTLLEDVSRRKQMGIDISPDRLIDLELLLTDSFLTLGNQLQSGRVKPKASTYEWYMPQNDRKDVGTVLERVARENADLQAAVTELAPEPRAYQKLRAALTEYRRIAASGGWKLITPGPKLAKGDRDKRVAMLRRRLAISHDLPEHVDAKADPRVFDEALEEGVRRFQRRHGLKEDGALGPGTLRALNVSAPKRVRQLELNLERLRWLPRDLGKRYLIVNIAAYELYVIDNGATVLRMPVVVGNQYRHTPVFSGTMTYLIVNPSWFVPAKIALEDLLPKVRKNPDYLEEHGFTVMKKEKGSKDWTEVEPSEIDWKKVDDENFGYRIKQNPGETNALGRVKFIFPNRFNVYLHDTPAKDLFTKRIRNFSSGCIRVERPLDLMSYVLHARAEDFFKDESEHKVDLPEPLPVHLVYFTAWVDDKDMVQFRPDIYEQDELLDQFL